MSDKKYVIAKKKRDKFILEVTKDELEDIKKGLYRLNYQRMNSRRYKEMKKEYEGSIQMRYYNEKEIKPEIEIIEK